jgi:hypothetical protein
MKGPQPYDAAQVGKAKDAVIEALKNATHIRGLKADEFVTVVLQGTGDVLKTVRKTRGSGRVLEEMQMYANKGPVRNASVMTLRAKKSDVDAFAKGKTDLETFKKKVTTAAYQRSSNETESEARTF